MNFKENDLSILNSVTKEVLHTHILGDLSNNDLVEIINTIESFKNGIPKTEINTTHLEETLMAIKDEAIVSFNTSTLNNLNANAQEHTFDCKELSCYESDEKVRLSIQQCLIGHAKEDCYIILSPMILTILQVGGSTSYVQQPVASKSCAMHEVGTLDDVRVFCNSLAVSDSSVIVGTSNSVYALTFTDVSFL